MGLLKVKWLGTGSAGCIYKNNWNTMALLEIIGYKMLFDCGGDARHALFDAGLSYMDIHAIFLSHLHGDHSHGLEIHGFSTYFDPRYTNKPALHVHKSLAGRLWSNVLSGGMESIQNATNELATYFEVKKIGKNGSFEILGFTFKPIQMIHIVNDATHEPAYGLMVTTPEDKKIFFTADTQHSPSQLRDFYNDADVIFQDCETLPFKSGVHAHFDELATLPKDIKKKMHLIHFQDNVVTDNADWTKRANENGFVKFVLRGDEFEF